MELKLNTAVKILTHLIPIICKGSRYNAKGVDRWRFFKTPKSTDLDPKGLQIGGLFCKVQEIKKSCNVIHYRILQ
jgi:hypothetical protein